jgi:hypothetical protein
MPPAFQYQTPLRLLIGTTLTASALLAGLYARTWNQSSGITLESKTATTNAISLPFVPISETNWMSIQCRTGNQPERGAIRTVPDRYRLAGTFFIEGAGDLRRKAILDSLLKREQFIVSEGDAIDDLTVDKIYYDHATLRGPSGSFDIWVEFSSKAEPAKPSETNSPALAVSGETNKFGCVKIQDNRWKFSRKPLLNYYQELLDEPNRMVTVFDTMKPVRDEGNKITGYVVGIEGEREFFEAVGLRQGDIVRTVNSLPMTNRRRAEAFIDQFLKDQMNAVVLEVERGGKATKQIYQMQP